MKNSQFYSIGKISALTKLSHSTIRFWEEKIPQIRSFRSTGGHRYYNENQLELILYVKKLLYDEKFTIEGAKKKIQNYAEDLKNNNKDRSVSDENTNDNDKNINIKMKIKEELLDILKILS